MPRPLATLRPLPGPRPAALALWAGLLLVAAAPLQAELFAGQITPENIDRVRLGGPDAIAGLGDWALGNGRLCAAISDPDHESVLSDRGGVLVDLGHCGRDDDQFGVLQPMLNLGRENVLPTSEIRAELKAGQARIITSGRLDGIRFETRYVLDLQAPERLAIVTLLERTHAGDAIFLFGDVVLHGHRQLTPFTLSTLDPRDSVGFAHPTVDVDSALAMAGAMVRSDLQVLVGGSDLEPAVSYGWQLASARVERRDGGSRNLSHLALNGEHFSIIGAYADTLLIGGSGKPGLVELAQTLLMDLEVGDRMVYERSLIVGTRADVASVTDQVWSKGPLVSGRLDDPTAGLHVSTPDGSPLTFVRPEPDGRFAFRVPALASRPYRLEIARAGGVERLGHEIWVGGPQVALGDLTAGGAARLALPRGESMRLVFLGQPPTPDPRIGGDLYDFSVGEERVPGSSESNHVSLAGVPDDPSHLSLPAGRYRVLATRGPEWSVSETRIELVEGSEARLEIEPPLRVIEAPGFVSADLHVHASPSDDSALPLRTRIAAFAAQGADVVVATEHDRIVDYAPTIHRLGLQHRIASVVGVEITSTVRGPNAPFTIGHSNAFPLIEQSRLYRGGAPRGENRRLREVVASLRGTEGSPMLQLNHPREGGFDSGLGSYFSHLGVAGRAHDPTRALDQEPNRVLAERDPASGLRDLDFDAVELLNGPSMHRYRMTRADWFAFLLQGEFRTGTANSDSHRAGEVVALPRNYVAYGAGRGEAFDQRVFVAAIRSGRLYGSTGPLLEVQLAGRGPGERYAGRSGTLEVRVQAAPWVPVDTLRVYLNGALYERRTISAAGSASVPLRFTGDGFVTVEVEGDPGSVANGSLYAALAPGFTPFAFSNPIFVDADGDGIWTPPGLPAEPPPTLASPTATP